MATATMALKISDGTTTIDLIYHSVSNPGYQLTQDWAPQVADLNPSELGGIGAYVDVVEDIPIRIFGTTAADAYSKAHTLNMLIDAAARWYTKSQGTHAVVLLYSPPSAGVSSVTLPLQAIILGPSDDSSRMLSLPATFNKLANGYIIDGIRLRILRRGPWTALPASNDQPGASGASANASVLTRTFAASHTIRSPMDVTIGGFNGTTTPAIKAGYLILGSQSTDIQVLEAEAATATAYTSVADSANNARGGSVLRYSPTGTALVTSGVLNPSLIAGQIAVIAAVRNNSGSTTFQLQANLSGFGNAVSTPSQLIDTSSAQPRLVLLGVVSGVANKLTLSIQASAASGSLDIDYIILVNLRDETCAVIAHDDISLANAGSGAASLQVLYNPTTYASPAVIVSGSSGNVPVTWRGVTPAYTVGADVYALWTATNGASWRFTTTAPAVLSNTLNVSRYKQYLVPQ